MVGGATPSETNILRPHPIPCRAHIQRFNILHPAEIRRGLYVDHNAKCACLLFGLSLQGDSGGPVTCLVGDTWYVAGIASFGPVFCAYWPMVYTRTSVHFDWIQNIIANN